MRLLSSDYEPAHLMNALPIKKGHLYLSTLLPTLIWPLGVITSLTLIVRMAGAGYAASLLFWLKSVLIALIFLSIALN